MSKASVGVIVRVSEDGLAFLEEADSKRCFAFTFDKIAGYRGQSAGELGLRIGSRVAFSYSSLLKVESVSTEPADVESLPTPIAATAAGG